MTAEKKSPGEKFRDALALERPLQIVGVINAFSALLGKEVGFRAIYLSDVGVANASFGLPDIGMTNASDVCEDIRETGSQAEAVSSMQTRERLYEILDYSRCERKLDELFGSKS
jgi:2-methylisocitrate lyase-like PEP mutase family enzyme